MFRGRQISARTLFVALGNRKRTKKQLKGNFTAGQEAKPYLIKRLNKAGLNKETRRQSESDLRKTSRTHLRPTLSALQDPIKETG